MLLHKTTRIVSRLVLKTKRYKLPTLCLLLNYPPASSDVWQPAQSAWYLLNPWNRVLLEKLTGLQLVKKFSTYCGTWRFITAVTSARHLSLSWASSIQSITPHPTSWRSILILSSHLHLGLPSGPFPPVSPPKPCIRLSSPHMRYMPRPSHSSRFYHPHNIGWGVQIIQLIIM